MATANYSYEKRQRELAKKRKKEEKLLRKTGAKTVGESVAPTGADATDASLPPSSETKQDA